MDDAKRLEAIEKTRQLCLDYQQTFDSEQGRRVYSDLMKCCGVKSLCFCANQRETDFSLGARGVGLYIERMYCGDEMKRIAEQLKNSRSAEEE